MVFSVLFFAVIVFFYWLLFGQPAKAKTSPEVTQHHSVEYPHAFGWVLATIVIAFQVLVYSVDFGVGIGLFNAVLVAGLFFMLKPTQRSWVALSMIGMSALIGLAATWRANGFVQSIDIAFIIGSLGLLVLQKSVIKPRWQVIWIVKRLFLLIPASIGQVFAVFRVPTSPEVKKKITVAAVLKTLVITFVSLFFFVGILSKADPVFAKLIETIWEQSWGRLLAALVVAFGTTIMATIWLRTDEDEEYSLRFLSFYDLAVPVGCLLLLFGTFLAIQARYLYGGHQDLSAFHLTYSEYVRKGFTELLWAAFCGSLISYVVYFKRKVTTDLSQSRFLTILSVLLTSELLLLLVSALKRNLLYIEAFGLTRIRVVGTMFLIWLAGVLLLLLALNAWKYLKERHFLAGVWVLSCVMILALNVLNIDRIIFSSTPRLEHTKDYFYLSSLSEDVSPEWRGLIKEMETEVNGLTAQETLTDEQEERLANIKLALIALSEKWEFLDRKYGELDHVMSTYFPNYTELATPPEIWATRRKWQSRNLTEHQAYVSFATNQHDYMGKVITLLDQIKTFQSNKGVDMFEQERSLILDYQRPFISTDLTYFPTRVVQPSPTIQVPTLPTP